MEVAFYLIIPALVLGVLLLIVFFIAAKNGQYEDLDSQSERMLHFEERISLKKMDRKNKN